MSPIESLPEELLLCIFEHLEGPAPSTLKNRHEPSLQLTSSDLSIYKDISLVSKRWRRIILPLLFEFSRLRLDTPPKQHWLDCPVCGETPISRDEGALPQHIDPHHAALFKHARASEGQLTGEERSSKATSLQWASRFYHSLKDFLLFVQANNLSSKIQSFALLSASTSEAPGRYPQQLAATTDFRYRAAAELWHHLFSVISNLARVALVAPPADMGFLTNCAIDLFGDIGAWAFADMEFHILELSTQDAGNESPFDRSPADFSHLSYVPHQTSCIAASSILNIRPWSYLALNEGSFLKAYGTYEYFERGPPSLIYSIKHGVGSRAPRKDSKSHERVDLKALRSFTYTAILPFANHLDFRGLLPYIDELDVMLAPGPESNILNDKDRVGKAELEDCWQEFFSAYHVITAPFRTFDRQLKGMKLKQFVCRDMRLRALRHELDEEFEQLCLPVWAEMSPGVFVRQQEGPPVGHFNG